MLPEQFLHKGVIRLMNRTSKGIHMYSKEAILSMQLNLGELTINKYIQLW